MVNVNKYIGDILTGSTALVALLGSANRILQEWPKDFMDLPIVSFEIANNSQADKSKWDDGAHGRDLAYNIDVWIDYNVSPENIIDVIVNLLNANEFFLRSDRPIAELNEEITHRHLVFAGSKMNEQISA